MTTESKTTVFTLKNPDGMYLKYFYAKAEKPENVIQFNKPGSSQRFHTCNSEKAIRKIFDKAVSMDISAEITEVDINELNQLKESTKNLPRLRHQTLVEKAEKPKKTKKEKVTPTLEQVNETLEAEADLLLPEDEVEMDIVPEDETPEAEITESSEAAA